MVGGIFTSGTSFIGLRGFAGVFGSISLVGLVPILLSPGISLVGLVPILLSPGISLVGLVPILCSPGVLTDDAVSGIAFTLVLISSTGLSDVLRETDGAVLGMAGIDEEKDIAIGAVAGAVLGTEGVMRGREMFGLNGVFILLMGKPIGVRLAVLGEKEKVVAGVWVMSNSLGLGKATAAKGMVVNGCLLM